MKRKKSEKGREQELTGEELAKWIHLENYAASETCLLIAETDRVLCILLCFFFHWIYQMKYNCSQDSFVILGWFVY